MALSISSASTRQWKYDVFLSFRGRETRHGFVSHLYEALESTGRINTFMDEEKLEVGNAISPNLLMAIEESRLAVVVLSPDYASSPWCLDELTKIHQSMEGRDRILPVFYHVDPSHVRHQLGSFAEAFTKHEEKSRHSKEKLDQWRLALKNVADISGWDTKNLRSERELVKRIVKSVRNKVLQVLPRSIPVEFKAQPTDDFESTRRARDDLIKALKDDEITAIGVYGTGGVGKTTLVKHVSAQARELGLVNYVIRAVVGQSPDLRNIQGTLADQLGLKFEKLETEIGRAARLLERIMGGNKILIVLEDVGKIIDLSDIGIPHCNELQRHNSKLILTSGSNSVCSSMQCHARIHLDTLSEEDSWNLFVEKSGKSFQESTELYDVARAVARECGGLPLALITVARALGDKDIEDWKEAAQRLDTSQTVNLEDKGEVYKCIKFSYEYLRSDDAKSFFLLCCLFPEDYDIPIEDLLMYAIGKGLLQDVKTIQEARATSNSVIKSLRHYGLLLDGTKEGCVRMHDVVRDVAVLISMYEDHPISMVISGCGIRKWPTIVPCRRYSAISLMMNDIRVLPDKLVCSELQILLLQNNSGIDDIPENFFKRWHAVRVLDISSTNISSPLTSFNCLTNLQALFLDYCNKLSDTSIFRNLKKLKILSMREFPLEELPKEIGYLTNLRMLDLSGSYKLGIFPYNVMSRLCKLEELYMQCNYGVLGSKTHGGGEETEVDLDKFIGLTHLNVVKLHISDAECLPKTVIHSLSWENFNICISAELPSRNYSSTPYFSDDHSRTLTLSTTIKSLPDWFINTVTKKAGKLQYLKCEGLNILVEYERGRLHGLKYLAVIGPHKNMEVLMDTITWVPNKPVFENLEELHLLGVSCLKALCLGELPPGSLFNLKSLKLEYCHDMVNAMLPSNLLKSIQNLEKLHCEDMNGMEYVFGYKGLEPEDIILTKLREMILWDLEKLISIWNCPAPNAVFRNLKSMAVSGCKKLKSLFTYDVAECLFHLEDLSVTQCPSLDRVIEPSKEAVNKKIVFPELKILALSYLPHLTRFCSTESATIECPSLEHLHVQACPHFTTSISDFHSWKQFQVNDLRHLRMSKDMVNIDVAGQHTMDILQSLPQNIRKRVEVIRDFQRQHDELQTKFFKERAALEAKYQKLYQPLFKKRCMIVNGVVEADGVTTEAAANQEDKAAKERGVCDFWLNALKNNDVLANQITERDERALKYLEDIKWFRIRNPKGFKLEFYFDTNPFFKNSILTKTYHMIGEDEPQKAVGTEIEWYQAKCLTQRTLKEKSKKGSKNSKPLTRTESCESFFNFFSPPQIPEDDADVDEDVAEELKNLKKQDYDIGSIIRYKIIPHAYSWFTGEAF